MNSSASASAVIAHGSPLAAPPIRMSSNCCQSTGRHAQSNIPLPHLPVCSPRASHDEARLMMEGGEGPTLDDLMGPESFLDDCEAFEVVDGMKDFVKLVNANAHGQLKNGDTLLLRTVSDISTSSDSAVESAAKIGQPESSKPAVALKPPQVLTSTKSVQKGRNSTIDARAKRHKRNLHRLRTARYRAKMANKKLLEKKADILMKGFPFDVNILQLESERYRDQLVACGSIDFEHYRHDIAEQRLENKVLKFEIKILEKISRSVIEKPRDENDLAMVCTE